MAGNTGRPGASLVARTLDVLATFDQTRPRQSLTEIASHAGLAPATTLRILRQLVRGGALTRNEADGRYCIGRLLWDLGHLAPVETDLRDVVSPFLHDLHAATRMTVHLGVRDGVRVLYLDRLSGRASVPVVSRVGSTLPLHPTGVGKVLLAHAPAEVVRQALRRLTRQTAHTITSPSILTRQLDQIRQHSYATTFEEMTLGACSVAVPVWTVDPNGERVVLASLGVVTSSLRRDKMRLVAALQVSASGIERALSDIQRT